MHKILFPILLLSVTFFTSCIDIIETFKLNKDGSGSIILKMDMGEMMKQMSNMKSSTQDSEGETEVKKYEKKDSTFTVFSEYTEDQLSKVKNADLLKKIVTSVSIDEEKGDMSTVVSINFDNMEELEKIWKLMGEMDKVEKIKTKSKSNTDLSPTKGMLSFSGTDKIPYLITKNTLSRTFQSPLDSKENKQKTEEEMKQELGMMEMFFADATYTIIYDMPEKVTSVTGPSSSIDEDGNAIQKFQFMDFYSEDFDTSPINIAW